MSYARYPRRASAPADRSALVTPRQAAALDKMATAHGFASGSALLADVASCTIAELGRKQRSVVQMFVDQAFTRYGRPAAARRAGSRYAYTSAGARMAMACGHEDYPACGCD